MATVVHRLFDLRSESASVRIIETGRPWAGLAQGFRAKLIGIVMLCAGLVPAAATAAPITYSVTGGSVQVSVFVGATLIGSTLSPAVGGTVTIDMASQSLDDLSISLAPNIGLSLATSYGGYDGITIESASVTDATGYSSILVGSTAGSFTVVGGPLAVSGFWGGTDSLGSNPPVSGVPISYAVPSITAVVSATPGIEINGVTLNALSGAFFGEAEDLTVLANILVTDLVVIPEPSTGLLVLTGLGLLSTRRPRS
jgi:hypothetical protein